MFRFGAIVCKFISEHYSKVHIADFASDGLEVLRRVRELQPDLVLLNISLPKLSIETARKSGNSGSVARFTFRTDSGGRFKRTVAQSRICSCRQAIFKSEG